MLHRREGPAALRRSAHQQSRLTGPGRNPAGPGEDVTRPSSEERLVRPFPRDALIGPLDRRPPKHALRLCCHDTNVSGRRRSIRYAAIGAARRSRSTIRSRDECVALAGLLKDPSRIAAVLKAFLAGHPDARDPVSPARTIMTPLRHATRLASPRLGPGRQLSMARLVGVRDRTTVYMVVHFLDAVAAG